MKQKTAQIKQKSKNNLSKIDSRQNQKKTSKKLFRTAKNLKI